ncbi:hypothetical protein BDV95DRAFT_607066 [Massariosphaeria phaeospora]|uniref:SH3 domain-containing protein n=1 Tax=Massariosphaeria phaeospora TaxID=100035 RepID=A0A7C8MKP0_9PLEO|nr:hypothetical protein BDV95DRAFT_607066 [Massariosphaeria phaeospora]
MALTTPAAHIDISDALSALQPLERDEYVVAFGPGDRQFCGTPYGYSASHLPASVITDIMGGEVKRIVWASFGSDGNSFFFAYEAKRGGYAYRVGTSIAYEIFEMVHDNSSSLIRVQLGNDGAYIIWFGRFWISKRLPAALLRHLVQISQTSVASRTMGRSYGMMSEGLANVTWHADDSYYVKHCTHAWNFESEIMLESWKKLWQIEEQAGPSAHDLADLAYVSIDTHSTRAETFVFIKKQPEDKEADFITHFPHEDVVSRLTHLKASTDTEPEQASKEGTGQHLQTTQNEPNVPHTYRWARSKNKGRPHPGETRELSMKKGEMVKVIQEPGNNWYIVENKRGEKGWAHAIWLDLDSKVYADPRAAYARFVEEMDQLLKPGRLRSFPDLGQYMDACTETLCQEIKQNGIGICSHDLAKLLGGSGRYSREFLRDERNKWHPDKFARFCHTDFREYLKKDAEAMFVLHGVLIDILENAPQ